MPERRLPFICRFKSFKFGKAHTGASGFDSRMGKRYGTPFLVSGFKSRTQSPFKVHQSLTLAIFTTKGKLSAHANLTSDLSPRKFNVKRAQANVITRREEVASTRSLLNTAKLMDENTTLYKLKELEYLERICEHVGNISVSSNGDIISQLTKIIAGKE